MNKMVLIGGGAAVLLAAGGGGAYFMMKPDPQMAANGSEPLVAAARETFYYNIQPEFVVNLQGRSRIKFLMVEMAVASFDDQVPIIIDDHMPELRNHLLLMLAEQDSESLKTSEGKLQLREQSKQIIDELVTKHYAPESVVDVFVTRLVMQ